MPIRRQSVEDIIENLEELLRKTGPGQPVPVEHLRTACTALTALNRRFLKTVRVSDNYQVQVRHLVDELQQALSKIRTMKGFVHICSSCKQISVDSKEWQPLEVYIAKRTDTRFSHGMCPDCAQRLYGDFVPEFSARAKREEGKSAERGSASEIDLSDPVVSRFLPVVNDPLLADKALHEDLSELFHKYLRLQRRLTRIVEISDRYQAEFRKAEADREWAARCDPLTGLTNRTSFQETLENERLAALASGLLPTLFSLKVANLREINRGQGLAEGDEAVRLAAKTLKAASPDLRFSARWSGATCAVLLGVNSSEPTKPLCERLRAEAEAAGKAMKPRVTFEADWAALRASDRLETWLARAGLE